MTDSTTGDVVDKIYKAEYKKKTRRNNRLALVEWAAETPPGYRKGCNAARPKAGCARDIAPYDSAGCCKA
jgi:hypothetical protein